MKGKAVKLRDAHKLAGSPALCSVVWGHGGRQVVTASSGDVVVAVHDLVGGGNPVELRQHKAGVTALALRPGVPGSLASGSIDHSVKLYSFPDGAFQSNVTRFTLPIRSLAFNRSGSLLAAAGDDDGIKLIATIDNTISKVLKGHKGSVTDLSFDPKNEYLASIDGFGTVIYWELSSGKSIHTLKAVAPACEEDKTVRHALCWSPDGETLAVPGLRNDVVMYDRDTGEKLFALKGEHEKPVCSLCWSPNGKYMATVGLDKQVLIWDVDLRQDIERHKFDERISCLAWKPEGNALALVDVTGKFGIWEHVVPVSMKSPIDGAPIMHTRHSDLFDEDESENNEETSSTSRSLNDEINESNDKFVKASTKRIRKNSSYDDHSDDGSVGEDELLHQIESHKASANKHKSRARKDRDNCASLINPTSRMQEAFQPGSTPSQDGKRRFLSYNMLGCITSIENDGYSHVEIDFHDTGRGPRVPSMSDYFGFTVADLNESGSVFANPCKGEKNTSTLMYRPFSSWANNSEWSMRLEGEEVKSVALGKGWVAAMTSLNFLRIFSEAGLQRHVISIPGRVVTAAGFENQLAMVTHSSECFSSGDQMLQFKVYNISEGSEPLSGALPLTPFSQLAWFGFNEEGQICSYDSEGILRVFCHEFGGSWLPLFSSKKARTSEDERHWVVGLNAGKLFCVVLKSPNNFPEVAPKPVLTMVDLAFPLASSDLGAADLENEFMMRKYRLTEIRRNIEELEASGLNTAALDDEVFDMEAAMDRCILRLIASCCNSDKLVRATELVKLLSMEKSVKGAIKLVMTLKLPNLAEKFSAILEERMLNSSGSAGAISYTTSKCMMAKTAPRTSMLAGTTRTTVEQPEDRFRASESTQSKRQEESGKVKVESGPPKEAVVLEVAMKLNPSTSKTPKVSSDQENTKARAKRDRDDAEKQATTGGASRETVETQCGIQKPLNNPFAKLLSKQEKTSLLESMKKLKRGSDSFG